MDKKLYVGNLSYNTTDEKLRSLFAEYGEIESINVITDRETGRPRGFAFVEMATQQAAEASISGLDGKMVDERRDQGEQGQSAARPQPAAGQQKPIRLVEASPAIAGLALDSRRSAGRNDKRQRRPG